MAGGDMDSSSTASWELITPTPRKIWNTHGNLNKTPQCVDRAHWRGPLMRSKQTMEKENKGISTPASGPHGFRGGPVHQVKNGGNGETGYSGDNGKKLQINNGTLNTGDHSNSAKDIKDDTNGAQIGTSRSGLAAPEVTAVPTQCTQPSQRTENPKLLAELLNSSAKKGKEPNLLAAMANLKSAIKQQNKALNALLTNVDHLKVTKEKTKSPTVARAIEEVESSTEALRASTSSVHSAFYEVEKTAIRTNTQDQNAANLNIQEAILKICEDLKVCVNKQQEEINVIKTTQAALVPSYASKAARHYDPPPDSQSKSVPQNAKTRTPQQVQSQQQSIGLVDQAEHEDKTSWRTVVNKKPMNRQKKNHKGEQIRTRPDVVIVKADQLSYVDMLKRIKTNDEVKGASEAITKITKTRDGHLRMVLSRETEDSETLTRAISNAIGNNASCTRLSDTALIEIRDADEEATDDEIIRAIEEQTKTKGIIKITNKRKIDRGTQIVTALVPTSIVNNLLKDRLRIGFVSCRTRLKTEVKKCFRCQGYGHTRQACTNEERSNLCWKCGEKDHKSKECKNEYRCMLCEKEVSNDHAMGSSKCHAYKRALEAAKTRK